MSLDPAELRVLDAAKSCCERWGIAKVTIDDIADEAGVSRATLYRMFPGGKDVLFEALRVRELEDFFTRLSAHLDGAVDFEDLLVRCVVHATARAARRPAPGADAGLRARRHARPAHRRRCAAHHPGRHACSSPRWSTATCRAASGARLVELLARLVISYFLAPSDHVDLGEPESARTFIRRPSSSRPSSHPSPGADPMTVTHNDNEAIIGRAEINDIEAILAIPTHDPNEIEHIVKNNADTIFTWDYSLSRPALRKLYEKAKVGQWNATTDLPWDTEVDVEKTVAEDQALIGTGIDPSIYIGTPVEKWGDKEWLEFGIESRNWSLSQFMHGEQGALLCTAKIVETVPWYDAKLYASTQVVDEARHVEVFARYLDEKLGGEYQINAHLRMLLDDIVNDSRWDMTYLGMQVMVEGLALAAFGFMHQFTNEPLLKQLLRYVMSDEARHVAFGVLSLKEVYDSHDRRRDEGPPGVRLRGCHPHARPLHAARGVGAHGRRTCATSCRWCSRTRPATVFQSMLFSKIVPNCKKLGLLDRNDKWLRRRFEEMGVIQFEDWEDTGEEYLKFELGAEAPAAL